MRAEDPRVAKRRRARALARRAAIEAQTGKAGCLRFRGPIKRGFYRDAQGPCPLCGGRRFWRIRSSFSRAKTTTGGAEARPAPREVCATCHPPVNPDRVEFITYQNGKD